MEKEGQSDVQGEHRQAGDLVKGLEAALQCVQVQDIAQGRQNAGHSFPMGRGH